jgi:hypothetical protein
MRKRSVPSPRPRSSPAQLSGFLAKYAPETARAARKVHAAMRRLVPGAVELVYDNYNGLVIGFCPSDRASDAVLSIFVARDHVSICFLQDGPHLPDPSGLLRGSGNVVRHIRLASPADLETAPVLALIRESLRRAEVPIDPKGRRRLVIRSVSKKQRPRRVRAS